MGVVPTAGWTDPQLVPYYYMTPPQDGFWAFDFIATPPAGPVPQVATPILGSYVWPDFPVESLKGVVVYGSQNEVRQPLISPSASDKEEPWPGAGGEDPWPM